jgi:hypothetical protein
MSRSYTRCCQSPHPMKKSLATPVRKEVILISCNRNHFLTLARQTQVHPGLIILIRRRTRQSECAHLSVLLQRAGEQGLRNNVNFA